MNSVFFFFFFSRRFLSHISVRAYSFFFLYLWPYAFFFFFFFFHLTYSRCTSSLPSCLWSQRIFPSLPGSRLTIFLSRCKFSTLTTRQPMVEFYLLTFPRFPLRKKEHKSYFGKSRTHDFRTSRCAAYLLDHSGDERQWRRSLHLHCERSQSVVIASKIAKNHWFLIS